MSALFIYSTLTSDQSYRIFAGNSGDVPQVEAAVFVAGKANVMNKQFVTPKGVATRVTAEQLEALEQNEVFRLHRANGFLAVSKSEADPDRVAADLAARDKSAPLTAAALAGAVDDIVVNKTAGADDSDDDTPARRGPGRPRKEA